MRCIGSDTVFVAAHSARIMVEVLREEGYDAGSTLALLGLTLEKVEEPDFELTVAQEIALQREFARLTRAREGLWYRTGLRYDALSYGALGLATLCAQTVGEALTLFADSFQDLNYSLLRYRVCRKESEVNAIEASHEDVPLDLWQFCHEIALGALQRLTADLSSGVTPFTRIESALHEPPAWLKSVTLHGTPISFGHPQSRWYLEPGAPSRRLPFANSLIGATYRRLCEKLIRRMNSQMDLVSRIFMLLPQGIAEDMSIGRVARSLNLGERTLQRKLAELGLTFSEVVGQVRVQRAKSMLQISNMPISRIAEELGFTERASFSHAFKRWTGKTPLGYRKAQREALL
ncbi:MAG TPA: helix-turn-helix domain-containing protein [Steroidobacteraceae bacterium]